MDTNIKQVTVKLDAKQSKPTNTKKNKSQLPDVDLNKEFKVSTTYPLIVEPDA